MVPAAVAVIIYSALNSSGVLNQTPILMAAGGAAILIVAISAVGTSTVLRWSLHGIAGDVSVPCAASSGDIVTGRRLRILLRFAWAVVLSVLWPGCYSNSGDSV